MKIIIVIIGWLMVSINLVAGQPQSIDQLIEQVRQTTGEENRHNKKREKTFIKERDLQKNRLFNLQKLLAKEKSLANTLSKQFSKNEHLLSAIENKLNNQAGDLNEVFAIVRQHASKLQSLVNHSMINAQFPQREKFLVAMQKDNNQSLSMKTMEKIWLLMLDEMNQNGKVTTFNSDVITATGEEANSRVTRAGAFTAISAGKYLRYLPATGKLVELARQPVSRYRNLAEQFTKNQQGYHAMAIDPTKGSLLALLVQTPTLTERIKQGGLIGYLILLLGIIGVLIVIVRFIGLMIIHQRIKKQLKAKRANNNNPLGRLVNTLKAAKNTTAEALTLHIDETINREANHINYGLTSLTVLVAISPLLGLLGTVTGMIETFQSISLFGTGDPRLMSSGISQALVTTQLGLAVAIPLLLLHSVLQAKANHLVDILDQQSARLFAMNFQ